MFTLQITDSTVQLHTMCTCGWIDAACDFFYTSLIAMFILVLLAIIKCVVAANLDLKATTNNIILHYLSVQVCRSTVACSCPSNVLAAQLHFKDFPNMFSTL